MWRQKSLDFVITSKSTKNPQCVEARDYRSLAFRASCLCPFKRDEGTTGTLIASLSITNGTILMHDESAILSAININPPFILFFVSVRREAR